MILDRTTAPYTVDVTSTVLEALRRISANKARVAFVLDEHGTVRGTLSDGDIRRWLVEHTAPTSTPRGRRREPALRLGPEGTVADIVPLFRDGVDRIPVLDERGRLVAVATPGARTLTIGRRTVGEDHPALIIGEIGNNHQGDVELAKTLVDHCVAAGVDVVKFQLRDMAALYRSGGAASAGEDLGPQYTMNLLAKYSLSVEDMYRVFDHCAAREVDVICTPWDLPSADALQRYGVPGFKIASADLTNHDLLAHVAGFGAPMIVSTGMSTEQEITGAVEVLRGQGAPFALLDPVDLSRALQDVNLRYMDRLASWATGWWATPGTNAAGTCRSRPWPAARTSSRSTSPWTRPSRATTTRSPCCPTSWGRWSARSATSRRRWAPTARESSPPAS